MQTMLRRGAALASRFRRCAVVLVYHRITSASVDPWGLSVTPQHFEQQLQVLQRHATALSLTQLGERLAHGCIPRRAVAVTFDDGYVDNLTNARPILRAHGIPATVFVATQALDDHRGFWWDELEQLVLHPLTFPSQVTLCISGVARSWNTGSSVADDEAKEHESTGWKAWEPPRTGRQQLFVDLWSLLHACRANERETLLEQLRTLADTGGTGHSAYPLLNNDQLRELLVPGSVDIGAHTVSHPSLATLPIAVQADEITSSKRQLEALLSIPINTFAYPFGRQTDFTRETIHLVRQAGFNLACINVSGRVRSGCDPLQLPRFHVGDWSGAVFADRLEAWLSG